MSHPVLVRLSITLAKENGNINDLKVMGSEGLWWSLSKIIGTESTKNREDGKIFYILSGITTRYVTYLKGETLAI